MSEKLVQTLLAVFAITNKSQFYVSDPYPKVNVTDNRGYAYVIEENKPSMILATFDVEAFMFAPKDIVSNISLLIVAGRK